ncbi:hypothetical protein SAMN04487905_10138 [Actinopolyspora xinjiangensis]|uniref:Uncharacterized protein n=1 Tax=Actinopolyspora xinjiangensis TaxID=405564 RepID=A0A1H0N9R6_9ACTN|nr:hypothetical protein [Actinopolyspora xinjiangensis]SDO89030.1 hypothetical protein SAMN04487905_10138 [Actinopolyspora xinjiangensis]
MQTDAVPHGDTGTPAPDDVHFADLMLTWARGVARNLVDRAGHEPRHRIERSGGVDAAPEFHVFVECWVAGDCAIYVRYRHYGEAVGVRIAELDLDRITGTRLEHARRDDALGSAVGFANNLYDVVLESGPPPAQEREWTDSSGYEWWGDPAPPQGWYRAIHETPRVETVPLR